MTKAVKDKVKQQVEEKKQAATEMPDIKVITAKMLAEDLQMDAKDLRKTLRDLAFKKQIQPKNGTWNWAEGSKDIDRIKSEFAKPEGQ